MDIASKNKLKKICDSLAEIGLSQKPPDYSELQKEGWVSAEDVVGMTGKSPSTVRAALIAAVKSGAWEETPASNDSNRGMKVYREVRKK